MATNLTGTSAEIPTARTGKFPRTKGTKWSARKRETLCCSSKPIRPTKSRFPSARFTGLCRNWLLLRIRPFLVRTLQKLRTHSSETMSTLVMTYQCLRTKVWKCLKCTVRSSGFNSDLGLLLQTLNFSFQVIVLGETKGGSTIFKIWSISHGKPTLMCTIKIPILYNNALEFLIVLREVSLPSVK